LKLEVVLVKYDKIRHGYLRARAFGWARTFASSESLSGCPRQENFQDASPIDRSRLRVAVKDETAAWIEQCPWKAGGSPGQQSHTALGEFYRRMRSKPGAPKAITAAAHKLARIVYHLLKTREPFDDSVFLRMPTSVIGNEPRIVSGHKRNPSA
jgi:hypothetical protein